MPTDSYIFLVKDKDGEYLFASFYSALGKTINKYCDELGINHRSLHKTRKTVASLMRANGVEGTVIQDELGHVSFDTTEYSYIYDINTEDEKYEKITNALN